MNRKKYHIFCDESGLKENYLIIGGFIIDEKIKRDIIKSTIDIKKQASFFLMKNWEIKAEKCNNKMRFELYSMILDNFFKYDFKYTATIFQKGTYNHSVFYNNTDTKPEMKGFYAFYKTMLFNNFIKDNKYTNSSFDIAIDERNNKSNETHVTWIKSKLNAEDYALKHNFNHLHSSNAERIKLVAEYSSKDCILLQISDLITYAVSFFYNRRKVQNEYKIQLAKKVATLFGETELNKPIEKDNLKIWTSVFKRDAITLK